MAASASATAAAASTSTSSAAAAAFAPRWPLLAPMTSTRLLPSLPPLPPPPPDAARRRRRRHCLQRLWGLRHSWGFRWCRQNKKEECVRAYKDALRAQPALVR